jgi:simple sugar transport system permease protein
VLDVTQLLIATLNGGIIISYAALGETFSELSGVYNFATEGIMLMAAATSFAGSLITGSPIIGLIIGITTGVLLGTLQAAYAVTMLADQVILGVSISVFIGPFLSTLLANAGLVGKKVFSATPTFSVLNTEGLPYPLNLILAQNAIFFTVFILAFALWALLFKTRFGLAVRAVGENPHVAAASGMNVVLIRYVCTILGSAIAALGGIFVVNLRGIWSDNLTGGRGFIGVAMVRVGGFRPQMVLLASMIFGLVDSFQLYFSAVLGRSFPYQFFTMTPYVIGIATLLISAKFRIFKEPAALGKPYQRGTR